MGYDLHIVRTREWSDAYKKPIGKTEVDELIRSDKELSWSKTDYVEMRDQGSGRIVRYWMIEWKKRSIFWWYRDQIQITNPDEREQIKTIQMAATLKAMVVGDDGERYELRTGFFRAWTVKTIPWPN